MLVLILKNFFIFNYLYNVLDFNRSYIKKFLSFSNKTLSFNYRYLFFNFKKFFFFKIFKKKFFLKLIEYYSFRIFVIKKKDFLSFDYFIFLEKKISFNKIFIRKTIFNFDNLIFFISFLNFIIKIVFFIV